MKKIIEDTLNKRIYEEDDKCPKCKKLGKIRRHFADNKAYCRECGHVYELPKQFLTTIKQQKPMEKKE